MAVGLVAGAVGVSVTGGGHGGVLWTGGFILAAYLLYSSWNAYIAARTAGFPGYSPGGWVVGLLALATVLMLGAITGVNYLSAGQLKSQANSVGSCWSGADASNMLRPVACDSTEAAYVATQEVTSPQACVSSYVDGKPGKYLCLGPR